MSLPQLGETIVWAAALAAAGSGATVLPAVPLEIGFAESVQLDGPHVGATDSKVGPSAQTCAYFEGGSVGWAVPSVLERPDWYNDPDLVAVARGDVVGFMEGIAEARRKLRAMFPNHPKLQDDYAPLSRETLASLRKHSGSISSEQGRRWIEEVRLGRG